MKKCRSVIILDNPEDDIFLTEVLNKAVDRYGDLMIRSDNKAKTKFYKKRRDLAIEWLEQVGVKT